MTTTKVQTIDELLRNKRDGGPKAPIYRKLDVSPGTYDYWEGGVYTPGDEHVEPLMDHLDMSEQDVVWVLYKSRRAKNPFWMLGQTTYRPLLQAA